MNAASRWRQTVAQSIAPVYAANPKVAAVILGGSTARGHADRYSDIEIGVFWHEPPTDEERGDVIARAGGDLIRLYPFDPAEQVWCDDFSMGRRAPDEPKSGVLIETVHYTTDFMASVLADVLERHDPSLAKQNLIAGVLTGIPLHGPSVIEPWQATARYYPDELAMAVVNAYATIDHYWRVEMLLERNENLFFIYEIFTHVVERLLQVLLGLNHAYYSGFKWLDRVLEHLSITPADLGPRLRRVYQVHPAEGGRQLAVLVEEIYDLVERHLPAVDVARLRRVFRYRRPVWDEAP